MPATATHEELTAQIVAAIEYGQTPPWRRPASDRQNDGFPTHPATLLPFQGVDVMLLNLAATKRGFHSRFWAGDHEWASLGGRVSGDPTLLADGTPAYNADQAGARAYRSRPRRTPAPVDYGAAEALITASGATIHFRLGMEAAYYYPPIDHIIFPLKQQFLDGPGGLPGYYDSLFHELAHFSEPRLCWNGPADVRELRAEMAAPFLTAQLGVPVLADMKLLVNHHKHLSRWVRAMRDDPALIFRVAGDASQAVGYLLSSGQPSWVAHCTKGTIHDPATDPGSDGPNYRTIFRPQ